VKSPFRKHGFTLLEILIAVTIFSIIISVVYGSYYAALQSARRCQTKIAQSRQARSLLTRMARQIRCCYLPPTPKPAVTDEKTTATMPLPENSPLYFRGGTDHPEKIILYLTTTAAGFRDNDLPWGPFEVAYKYDALNQKLYYHQQKFIPIPKNPPHQWNWSPLAQNVSGIELTFFNENRWFTAWDFKDKKTLPQSVKISLYLSDADHEPAMFSTIAPIAAAPVGTILPADEK